MDFSGQTTVLSAIFLLVGMMFLVPAETEKALARTDLTATGTCGPEGQTHPCKFTLVGKDLEEGIWINLPTGSGTHVTWSTSGGGSAFGPGPVAGDEKGSVTYKVGEYTAVLSFENPATGFNKCSVSGVGGSCTAPAFVADAKTGAHVITYSLSTVHLETCKKLKATIAEDELANSAQWKSMHCESLLK